MTELGRTRQEGTEEPQEGPKVDSVLGFVTTRQFSLEALRS